MSEETTIPQMREALDNARKALEAANKQNQNLATQVRTLTAREAFAEAGYQRTHADLFVAKNPEGEITPDTISAFVDEFGLVPAPKQEEPAAPPAEAGEAGQGEAPSSSGLASMSRGGSRPGESAQQGAQSRPLTQAEWQTLYAENPAAARKAVNDGRVQIRADNPYADRSRHGVGRENPYAAFHEQE